MVLLNYSDFFWFLGFIHCKPVYAKIIQMNITDIKIQNVDLTALRHEVNYTIND